MGLHFERAWLRDDAVAGLVLAALLVPQGMAYAELAGLPPETGLYTTIAGLIAYALIGSSPILVLGPDSSLGPLIAATILPLVAAGDDPGEAVALAGMLAVLTGVICIVAAIIRLGAVAELLSKPIRVGYINGLALVVIISQLPKLFGFSVGETATLARLGGFVRGVEDGLTDGVALALGSGSLAVILVLRRFTPRIPGVLVALLGATAVVIVLDLSGEISVVGSVPSGIPRPQWPGVPAEDVAELAAGALAIAFLALADSTALARSLPGSGRSTSPTREIIGLGAANVAAGLFRGFPTSASSSRTAVVREAGARSQLAGLIGAAGVAVVLLGGQELIEDTPSSVLAAVVLAAAIRLFDLAELRWLGRVRRTELALALLAMAGVVVVGVLEGIVIAIVLSLGDLVRRAWRPHDAVLGRIPGRKGYHDVERHPDARFRPGLVLYRFDAPLFFANSEHFARRLHGAIESHEWPVRWVVLAAEPMTDVDSTGAEVLGDLLDELEDRGVRLAFAELKGPVKDQLVRFGLYDRIGGEYFFPTLGTAVGGYEAATGIAGPE